MRKRREIQNNATYHVYARANRGEFILHTDESKDLFMSVVQSAGEKYSFQLINYCIMSNHIHLMIKPATDSSLSNIMRYILGVFAKKYNKIFGLSGHVWQDRFKSVIVKSFTQFINTFRYICNNPVKAGICRNAENYFYCGLYELKKKYLRFLNPPDNWLDFII